MLRETSPDDEVILSFNGHGLIDTSLNFYFATYDVNFNAPAEKGLSYSDISSLLDEIPARKKMILMDACHSGPIDKENSYERVLDTSADGTRRGLVLKQSNKEESNFLLGNTFRLMQTLFSDISENNGSLIIAAAGGDEVAFENNYWKNGVFTYCVRKALEEKRADLNKDGEIEVDELKKYVTEQVEKLTKGKQKPTSRQDNPKTKWVLAIDQTIPE